MNGKQFLASRLGEASNVIADLIDQLAARDAALAAAAGRVEDLEKKLAAYASADTGARVAVKPPEAS